MNPSRNAAVWSLACRLFSQSEPTLEVMLPPAERAMLTVLIELKAVNPYALDLRYVLCPYCQLQRGQVFRGSAGLMCQCPDCGPVSLSSEDTRAWTFDAAWLTRKLRAVLDIPGQQAVVSVVDGIWRIGVYRRHTLILARRLDHVLLNPATVTRADRQDSKPAWLITPKPSRNVIGDLFDGAMVWLPLEERFSLYGGHLQFAAPGNSWRVTEAEALYAVHGPFSADFRKVHLPDWPHGVIHLSAAQAAVFKALWGFQGEPRIAEAIMARAGLSSDKPIDVFKVKTRNQGDPQYEGPLYAYKALVTTDQHAGTYAMPCAAVESEILANP